MLWIEALPISDLKHQLKGTIDPSDILYNRLYIT